MRALWPIDKPVKAERKGQVRLDFAEAETGLQSKQQDAQKRITFPKESAEKTCFFFRAKERSVKVKSQKSNLQMFPIFTFVSSQQSFSRLGIIKTSFASALGLTKTLNL